VPKLMQVGRVLVAVSDKMQPSPYTPRPWAFSLTADVPFGRVSAGLRSPHQVSSRSRSGAAPGATTSPGG